jgi:hypothetical protein
MAANAFTFPWSSGSYPFGIYRHHTIAITIPLAHAVFAVVGDGLGAIFQLQTFEDFSYVIFDG